MLVKIYMRNLCEIILSFLFCSSMQLLILGGIAGLAVRGCRIRGGLLCHLSRLIIFLPLLTAMGFIVPHSSVQWLGWKQHEQQNIVVPNPANSPKSQTTTIKNLPILEKREIRIENEEAEPVPPVSILGVSKPSEANPLTAKKPHNSFSKRNELGLVHSCTNRNFVELDIDCRIFLDLPG